MQRSLSPEAALELPIAIVLMGLCGLLLAALGAWLLEGTVAVLRPLIGVQRPLRLDPDPRLQVVDLLEHAKLLRDRPGAGGAQLAFFELAPAGIDGFERPPGASTP